jgi:hypothetical protein
LVSYFGGVRGCFASGVCGFCLSAKCPNIKFQWIVALAICSAVVASLALWTQGWGNAAMDNWSRGAPPLTLVQLAGRIDSWPSAMARWLAAVVLTAPMFYLLATRMLFHKRGERCEG